MWKKFLRNYFTFNKRERNGLIVLLLAMLIITFWPTFYSWWHKDPPADFTAFKQAIDSLSNHHSEAGYSQVSNDTATSTPVMPDHAASLTGNGGRNISLFPFDPNTLDEAGWRRLGVPERTIRTILKYRSRGGKFYRKEDLKKVYGFSESDFTRLEPYITPFQQANVIETAKQEVLEGNTREKLLVALNSADSIELVSLRGLGPVLSSRILKYRARLGGYASLVQLLEVYGLSPESYGIIKEQLSVDASEIRKIAINEVSLNDLKQHPYFRNPLASMVISYRDQHGPFDSPEKLKNVELINDSVYRKIIPYLKF